MKQRIARRKRARRTILPEDYRLIVDNLKEIIYVVSLAGIVIYLNRYGRRVAKSRIGDVLGRPFSDIIAPEFGEEYRARLARVRKGRANRPMRLDVLGHKGKRIPVLITESILRHGSSLIGTIGVLIDMSQVAIREAEIMRQMKEIAAQNAIAQILSQPHDLNAVLRDTLSKIIEVTETDGGGICLLDDTRQELILRSHRGLSPKVVAASTAIRIGDGISGRVAATNKPVVIADLGADKKLTRPLLLREGFRSAVVVPITLRGEVIGVFNVLSRRVRAYQPGDVELLIKIGNQIGIAVENAFLVKSRDEEISRLNALNRISRLISSEISLDALLQKVYEHVDGIMHPQNFCITLYHEDARSFEAIMKYEQGVRKRRYFFPADRGLSSAVFFKKKPILTEDYLTECKRQCIEPYGPPTKAWLGVPIVERGKAIGCIYVYDFGRSDAFSKHDLELLSTIAGQTAVVVENVRQYKALKERVEELDLLFQIGQSVVSTFDLESVLELIVKLLKEKFRHEKCAILLVDAATGELYIKTLGVPMTGRAKKFRIKIDGEASIIGHVAQTGITYYAPDVRKDKLYLEVMEKTRSEVAVPLKVADRIIGVLDIEADIVDAFSNLDIRMLESVGNQAAIAIDNVRLYRSLESSYFDTIRALVSAMEAKDAYTRGHSERVRGLSIRIADYLDLTREETKTINYAGYLHDIGKIGVSDTLLSKVEPLANHEFAKIRLHPVIGHNMIKHVDFLSDVAAIIRHEHEKYDGTGYPDGLKGDEIPLGARIIAVADAYDAMTTDRPYRKALGKAEAVLRLKNASGTQFDPTIVGAILSILDGRGRREQVE